MTTSGVFINGRNGSKAVVTEWWVRSFLKRRNSSVSVSFLAPAKAVRVQLVESMLGGTVPLGMGRNTINTSAFLCAPDMVPNVSNREV